MKNYTIIGGINGTGKSSLTGVLKREQKSLGQVIDVDRIASLNGGNNILAGRIAIQQIRKCIKSGVDFTQETTLSGSLIPRIVRQVKENGYNIRMYYIGLESAEESILRIKNRVKHGGHNISSEDVYRRFGIREQSLARVIPYCKEVVFFDNSNGFCVVAEYRNGEISCFSTAPKWMLDLAEAVEKIIQL